MSYFMSRHHSALSDDQIRTVAPSVFATEAWHAVSDRYQFIPTSQIVSAMREEGFMPVKAAQSSSRIPGKKEFTKHMIRFRHADNIGAHVQVNQEIPEIVLVNSHDRSSGYQLSAGIFRVVCSNGMIVKSNDLGSINVHHTGKSIVDDVIEGTFSIVEDMPLIQDQIEQFKAINLTSSESQKFAEAALALRYPLDDQGNSESPILASRLLTVRRHNDIAPNLWSTLNRVQENMIKGGLRGRTANGGRTSTRQIKSVSEDVRLNKALWMLAESMKDIKAAG